jgi:hypothetical protein
MHLPGNRAKDLEPGSKKAFHAEDFRGKMGPTLLPAFTEEE